jgi:hypothetical protein
MRKDGVNSEQDEGEEDDEEDDDDDDAVTVYASVNIDAIPGPKAAVRPRRLPSVRVLRGELLPSLKGARGRVGV